MELLKIDNDSIITIDSFFTCNNWYIQYSSRLFSKKYVFDLRKLLTLHILNSQNLSHVHFYEVIWMEIGRLTFGNFYHRCLEAELVIDDLFKNRPQTNHNPSKGGLGGGGGSSCSSGDNKVLR